MKKTSYFKMTSDASAKTAAVSRKRTSFKRWKDKDTFQHGYIKAACLLGLQMKAIKTEAWISTPPHLKSFPTNLILT